MSVHPLLLPVKIKEMENLEKFEKKKISSNRVSASASLD